ncbi:hypothetical protein EVJ58_g6758 [Rhodofomes roseus]|uniref:Protein kinase domain-containing protein n=1 Tax=Rhodofomes roseus TaxID=34475 RepID=A0A4Y9Y6Q1_9APHY|nr:hypothetical protein EVJ58_g6758 [Rhodofomes roseus]
MPFKLFAPASNLFGMSSGPRKVKPTRTLPCKPVKVTEHREHTAWSCVQDAVDADDVHVRLVFDEAGSIIACKAEPVEPIDSRLQTFVSRSLVVKNPTCSQYDVNHCLLSRMASTHTFHTIDLSDGKTSQRTLQTVSTVTLPVPASPALSRTSTLGVVTLVKDRYTGRSHALKVTKAAKLKPKSYLHLFEEQTTLKRLAGIPWFVELQGSFYDSAHFFLLMKYYPNGSLGSFLGRGRLSPVDARRFAAELIFALGLLREKRVVHGDIKPDNLLLDNRGHLVVADFGMARSFNEPSPLAPWKEFQDAMEEAGIVEPKNLEFERADATCRGVGTPVYMAPEVWRKPIAPQSYPADVWSAGVTIYEMLTGRLPFGPHSKYLPALETCFATIRKPLTFPDDLDIDVDDDARDLVHKMLQVDASKRPSIAAIKKHPYFMSINWLEVAMRQIPVTTHLPAPVHESVTVKSAFIPTPAPFGEDDDDKDPWWWFSWVSPTMNAPPEDADVASDIAVDVLALAATDAAAPPLIENVSIPSCPDTSPSPVRMFWGALKRKLAFAA